MEKLTSIAELRRRLAAQRRSGRSIGYVPGMGYFHEGHLSLMRRARAENDVLVVGVFVNRLQFEEGEDFDEYPRDFERDARLAAEVGADLFWAPSESDLFPRPGETFVESPRLGAMLEGRLRPNHFRGVCTIVVKLLNIVQPDRFYLGEKDYQQVVILERLVKDLNFPVEVVRVPTAREPDGLACSSRNVYLSDADRRAATCLHVALERVEGWLADGVDEGPRLRERVEAFLREEPRARIEEVAVCDAVSLDAVAGPLPERFVVLLHVRFGSTLLLDEREFAVPAPRRAAGAAPAASRMEERHG